MSTSAKARAGAPAAELGVNLARGELLRRLRAFARERRSGTAAVNVLLLEEELEPAQTFDACTELLAEVCGAMGESATGTAATVKGPEDVPVAARTLASEARTLALVCLGLVGELDRIAGAKGS